MPASTIGTGTPVMASAPPIAIASDEGRRHQPQRAAAELPGEDADGDHRQDVIEPAERVREAVHESVHLADAGMRQGGGRHEREGGGDGQASAHGWSPLAASAGG